MYFFFLNSSFFLKNLPIGWIGSSHDILVRNFIIYTEKPLSAISFVLSILEKGAWVANQTARKIKDIDDSLNGIH